MVKGDRVNGFTLLELIVFVVVAGIFIPMAYIAFMTASRSAAQPDAVMRARFLAETKMEDLTGMTYAAITTPQTSYISVTSDPRFGSPPMPWPNPYTGYQWRWTIQDVAYQGRTTHGSPAIGVPELWQSDTQYRIGDYVQPISSNNHFYRAALRSITVAWPPPWESNHLYNLCDYVVPTTGGTRSYRCIRAGTSTADPLNEPAWGSIPTGGEIDDGTTRWREDTATMTTCPLEPSWPVSSFVDDGSVRWYESTVYKQITVYVRDPKGYEYVANTIVTARPKA